MEHQTEDATMRQIDFCFNDESSNYYFDYCYNPLLECNTFHQAEATSHVTMTTMCHGEGPRSCWLIFCCLHRIQVSGSHNHI